MQYYYAIVVITLDENPLRRVNVSGQTSMRFVGLLKLWYVILHLYWIKYNIMCVYSYIIVKLEQLTLPSSTSMCVELHSPNWPLDTVWTVFLYISAHPRGSEFSEQLISAHRKCMCVSVCVCVYLWRALHILFPYPMYTLYNVYKMRLQIRLLWAVKWSTVFEWVHRPRLSHPVHQANNSEVLLSFPVFFFFAPPAMSAHRQSDERRYTEHGECFGFDKVCSVWRMRISFRNTDDGVYSISNSLRTKLERSHHTYTPTLVYRFCS